MDTIAFYGKEKISKIPVSYTHLYTGVNVLERTGLLRQYIVGGGKNELEAAFLHRCSGLYLMNGEKMDRYIITDIGRVAARGEPLSDMCRLAFLEYFARNRDERGERVDLLIKMCIRDRSSTASISDIRWVESRMDAFSL